jgi:hypothetical protein
VLIARFQPGGILTLANRLWDKRAKPRNVGASAAGASHAS